MFALVLLQCKDVCITLKSRWNALEFKCHHTVSGRALIHFVGVIVQLRFSWDLLLWLNKVKEDKLPFIWWQQYYCTSWPNAVQWQHLRVWCYSGQRHTRCFLYSSECSLIPGAVQRPATSWIDSIMWQYRSFPWAELSPHIREQIKANNNQIWKTSVQIFFVFNWYNTGTGHKLLQFHQSCFHRCPLPCCCILFSSTYPWKTLVYLNSLHFHSVYWLNDQLNCD